MESAGSLLMSTKLVRQLRLLLVVMTLPVAGSAVAQDGASETRSALLSGTLSFLGHSTVGDFVGSTSHVSGAVAGDPSGAHGWVEAPVATLVTHNDHRDRDLRAAMEVDRYPTMRFDLDSVVTVSSREEAGETFDVLLHGRLAIHGVTRVVELPAAVSRRGDTLHVNAGFPVDVTDYRVGGLKKLFGILRMRRQIEVRVDLRFVRATNALQSLTSNTQEKPK
jgi:polyisoprenoid-binding protein YceI